jgi:hypothetical protein
MAKGALGYFRFPEQRAEWGGPFNGQACRIAIFRELHRAYRFDTIFETGTYRGSTTEFLARETRGKVRSVEADPWSYGYCLARFLFNPRVSVDFADSRAFLNKVRRRNKSPLFFYLDAHWGEDLPLRQELSEILARWDDAIIMIDDFQVPDDANYGCDDYGDGKRLALPYIEPLIGKFRVQVFFPAARGSEESGARRGCAILLGHKVPLPDPPFVTLCEYRFEPSADACA